MSETTQWLNLDVLTAFAGETAEALRSVRPPEAKVILSRSQNAGDEVLGIMAWDIITSDVPRLAQTVIDVTAERDDLRARLGAVEALHTEMTVTTGVSFIVGEPPRTLSTKQTCAYCSTRFVGGSEAVGWPCPTIAAVNSAAARASAVPHGIGEAQ